MSRCAGRQRLDQIRGEPGPLSTGDHRRLAPVAFSGRDVRQPPLPLQHGGAGAIPIARHSMPVPVRAELLDIGRDLEVEPHAVTLHKHPRHGRAWSGEAPPLVQRSLFRSGGRRAPCIRIAQEHRQDQRRRSHMPCGASYNHRQDSQQPRLTEVNRREPACAGIGAGQKHRDICPAAQRTRVRQKRSIRSSPFSMFAMLVA